VWLALRARGTTDRVLAIVAPISAFVATRFEHSVANMYFMPMGLLIKASASARFWASIGRAPADFPMLTWGRFLLANPLPVTTGNLIGGAAPVGAVYRFVYLRHRPAAAPAPAEPDRSGVPAGLAR